MPPRPSGPFPAPHAPPPGGAPAQRSPLHDVDPLRRPDDDRTSLVKRPPTDRGWRRVCAELLGRDPVRYGVIGVLALVQAFVLFSAVMWWLGSSAPSATPTAAPMTWTGIVHDVGAAGVNLRSAAQVRPDDARDTAARGARLALSCGETGDVVAKGPVKTATWLRTTDGLFVSMLYVRVDGHTSIPSCNGSTVDGPLVALADPANPALPPPPGTQLGTDGAAAGTSSSGPSGSPLADGSPAAGAPRPAAAAAGLPAAGSPGGPASTKLGSVQVPAAPAPPLAHGTGTAGTSPPKSGSGGGTTGTTTGSGTALTTGTAPPANAGGLHPHEVATDPDTTPVG